MHVVITNRLEICSHAGQFTSSHLCISSGVGLQILPVETFYSISGLRPFITAHSLLFTSELGHYALVECQCVRDVAC